MNVMSVRSRATARRAAATSGGAVLPGTLLLPASAEAGPWHSRGKKAYMLKDSTAVRTGGPPWWRSTTRSSTHAHVAASALRAAVVSITTLSAVLDSILLGNHPMKLSCGEIGERMLPATPTSRVSWIVWATAAW